MSDLILEAWLNTSPAPGWPYRAYDCDGREIGWFDYGRDTDLGWQIDHILPVSFGGLDAAYNVRARHHRGNAWAGAGLGVLASRMTRQERKSPQGALAAALTNHLAGLSPRPRSPLAEALAAQQRAGALRGRR